MDARGGALRNNFTSYTANIRDHILPVVGDKRLADLTVDDYRRVLDHAVPFGESRVASVARTLGTLRTWVCEQGWETRMPPFGHDAALRRAKRTAVSDGVKADLDAGRMKTRITTRDCPTFEELQQFRSTLAQAAGDRRWKRGTSDGGYLGDVPLVQYSCGHRIGEVLVAHADHFDLEAAQPMVSIDFQLDDDIGWTPDGPGLTLTKNRKSRTAAIMEWAVEDLAALIEDARQNRNGWLFAPPGDVKDWDRVFSDLHLVARETANSPHTSHQYRHAYASYMLAPVGNGGYGRDLRTVSIWLGHSDPQVSSERYWHPVPGGSGWSVRTPGDAA